eukprot:5057866-Heterocapsa_arctica.AAC.1
MSSDLDVCESDTRSPHERGRDVLLTARSPRSVAGPGRPYTCTRTGVHDKGVLQNKDGHRKTMLSRLNIGSQAQNLCNMISVLRGI